jgi:uncharacterized protein (TIGR00290 family)
VLALHRLSESGRYRVRALLTTLTEEYDRVSMHGVRRRLLHDQALSLGLPSEEVWIPRDASNVTYEKRMGIILAKYLDLGVSRVAFGDLFLPDIRAYREIKLREIGMKGVFPLWHRKTERLAKQFLDLGFKAVTCCVDSRRLPRDFCGVPYDLEFLGRLPRQVDPCGENGEFHTFVFDGPLFNARIDFDLGEVVSREGFYFADLVPVG